MPAHNVRPGPSKADGPPSPQTRARSGIPRGRGEPIERYRPLPTGTHGLDPELVKRDQRERLQEAMIELIAEKGYAAVRIIDLARLAHVSQPTFYKLYADKEDLFLSVYDEIAGRAARTVIAAYAAPGSADERLVAAMRAFGELAAAEPEMTSLLVLGAFGAGGKALERRRAALEALERTLYVRRDNREAAKVADPTPAGTTDLTVKFIIGGIREVTATRLREGRASELPALSEELARWAACYRRRLPAGLDATPAARHGAGYEPASRTSERARRAEGRLPSGRSDLPRQEIVKSQRERIVDATAAIVAEKGLAALTVPEIARRANVSNQTFYDIYASKHEAFLGAQKVGMHQALRVAVDAYETHARDWPAAIAAGARALIDYLASEPAHAHLTLVDTFAACPEAIEIRTAGLHGFATYLAPGYALNPDGAVPAIAAEAVTGGMWEVLHHYIDNDCVTELTATAPQLTYFALMPFLGPVEAAEIARQSAAALVSA